MDRAWVGPPIDVRALFPVERREPVSVLRELDESLAVAALQLLSIIR